MTTSKILLTLMIAFLKGIIVITSHLKNVPTYFHLLLHLDKAVQMTFTTLIAFIRAWVTTSGWGYAFLHASLVIMTSGIVLSFLMGMAERPARVAALHSDVTNLSATTFRDIFEVLDVFDIGNQIMV